MMRKRNTKWIAVFGLCLIFLAGCSLSNSDPGTKSIDPPPDDIATEGVLGEHWDVTGHDHDEVEVGGELAPVTLYFKDEYDNVTPVTMKIPMTVEIAEKAMEYMIDGSVSNEKLPAGFSPLIPAGTTVLGINIQEADKLAIVDFSEEFGNYEAKDERRIVEAITWMLTGFPTIDQVKLRIDGEPLHQMPVAGFPLQEPLTRAVGINLERIEGINLAAAQPVTLYFKSETSSDFAYMVPVTRMVDRGLNKAEAVLQELIEGPDKQGLYAVLAPDVQVLDLMQGEGLVTVDFNDYVLDPEFRVLQDTMQSVVLSLTENQLAEQVQIKVNGNVEVLSSSDQSLTQPVTRPDHINVYGL